MAFKTFAPGVLTSSDVNTFLMRQAVITCTAATRPASPNEGMTIYETDTDSYRVYTGAAWINALPNQPETWTPAFGSGCTWTPGNATFSGQYLRLNRWVYVNIYFKFGSSSSADATPLIFTLPAITSADFYPGNEMVPSQCEAKDASTGSGYILGPQIVGNDRVGLRAYRDLTYIVNAEITSTVPFAWATDDEVRLSFIYASAADR